MNKLITILILTVYSVALFAQNGFIKKHVFGQGRAIGHAVYETNGRIFCTGITIDSFSDNEFNEQGVFIAEFDEKGKVVFFDRIQKDSSVFFMNIQNNLIRKNESIYALNSGSNKLITRFDLQSNKYEIDRELDLEIDYFFTPIKLQLIDSIFVLVSVINEDNGWQNILLSFIEKDTIRNVPFIDDSWSHSPEKTILSKDSTILIVGNMKKEANEFVFFLYEFDLDGNFLYQYYNSQNNDIGFTLDAILIDEEHLVISALEFKNINERYRAKPIIYKLNFRTGEIAWKRYLGPDFWDANIRSYFNKILPAIDGKGYILCGGQRLFDQENDSSYVKATLAKISEEGDSLWYRSFSVLEENGSAHTFYDMDYTSDGGYILTGVVQHGVNTDCSVTPCWQTLLVKTDANGEITSDSIMSQIDVEDVFGEEIKVFPNPVKDVLNIQQGGLKNLNFKLIDNQGHCVKEFFRDIPYQTSIIDVELLSVGLYFLVITDFDGNRAIRKIVKQ